MADLDRRFCDDVTPLLRYLERQTSDRASAEELAQATFVRALRHELRTSERAWLFTNLLRDNVRRHLRQRRHHEQIQHNELERACSKTRSSESQPSGCLATEKGRAHADRNCRTGGERDHNFIERAQIRNHFTMDSVGCRFHRSRSRGLQEIAERYDLRIGEE